MITDLLLGLILVMTLISVWAVFFFGLMYLLGVIFYKMEFHNKQKSKEQ